MRFGTVAIFLAMLGASYPIATQTIIWSIVVLVALVLLIGFVILEQRMGLAGIFTAIAVRFAALAAAVRHYHKMVREYGIEAAKEAYEETAMPKVEVDWENVVWDDDSGKGGDADCQEQQTQDRF